MMDPSKRSLQVVGFLRTKSDQEAALHLDRIWLAIAEEKPETDIPDPKPGWWPLKPPSHEQIAWVIEKLIENRGCSFGRLMERMDVMPEARQRIYKAGGQAITNALAGKDETT